MHPLQIRPSEPRDLADITSIYAHNVLHGTGTFELDPPSQADIGQRRDDVLSKRLPWLVAEQDGVVLGYAYANHFRPRLAFRFAVEDSVYLAPEAQGRGVGTLLLAELMARCTAAGARQMVAVIGDSANLGSIALHRRCGFADAGILRATGWKFDRWLDVVLMQRELGTGAAQAPIDPPSSPPQAA
ncbi:MAG: N-acetyltransferase family protein [Leptothrix sp. (in: b-proteobacteria)]